MGKLSLVFPHPGIYEVLLGTAGVAENISPIGIRVSDDFRIRVYSGSLTLQNLSIHPYCLLLITQDPVLFF
ncbi:DUF447 domain-containing protein [Metallosphaera hakonensis]|nr:DUF447 domain-containing protein [Metallosphaera hakonensis]